MEQLVARLEAATVRLEGLGAGAPAAGSGSAAPVAQAAPVAAAAVASSGSEAAFASLIAGEVAALEAATAKVGDDDVTKSTKFLTDALRLEGGVVSAIAQCKAPAMAALQELLAPIAALMTAAADFERDRKNKAFHHTKVIAEWYASSPIQTAQYAVPRTASSAGNAPPFLLIAVASAIDWLTHAAVPLPPSFHLPPSFPLSLPPSLSQPVQPPTPRTARRA